MAVCYAPVTLLILHMSQQLVSGYPVVSQTLRKALCKEKGQAKDAPKKKEENTHRCCGMGMKDGLGHADLDHLLTNPRHMKFTIGS